MLDFKTKFDSKDDRIRKLIIVKIFSYEKLTKKLFKQCTWLKQLDCYQLTSNEKGNYTKSRDN